MAGSLKMACHRASHDSKANKANIDHLIFLSLLWLWLVHMVRVPPKAFEGGFLRLLFAANPAAIFHLIQILKQKGIVYLAGPGFVAARIIGELNVRDTSEMLLQSWCNVTFHHLHVVNVILN